MGAWLAFPAASAGVRKDVSSAHKLALSHKRKNKQTHWEVETGDFFSPFSFRAKYFEFSVLKLCWAVLCLVEELQGLPAAKFNRR